jgi:O-antigen/teichoic acid export membrane protein
MSQEIYQNPPGIMKLIYEIGLWIDRSESKLRLKLAALLRKTPLRALMTRTGFWASVATLAAGTVVAQAVPVLVSPILTRLYTPHDFGILALFASTLAIITTVAGLRFEFAAVLAAKKRDAVNLLATALLLVTLAAILTGVAGGLRLFQYVPGLIPLQPYWAVLAIAILLTGAFLCLEHWAVRVKAYRSVAAARIRQGFAGALCQCLLFKVGIPGTGLLIGYTVGQALGSTSLAKKTGVTSREMVSQMKPSIMAHQAVRHWQFPALVTPSALINALGSQAPTILLAAYYGVSVAGWYALGQRIIGLPIFFIGRAVSQAFLGEGSTLAQERPAEFLRLFVRTAQQLAMMGLVMLVVIAVAAPFLIRIIFGSPWIQSGYYLQSMAPAFYAGFVNSPLSQTLNMVKRPGISFILDCVRLLFTVLSLAIPFHLGVHPSQAIMYLSAVTTLTYGFYFFTYLFVLKARSANLEVTA